MIRQRLTQVTMIASAGFCFALALLLFRAVGLPDRAAFTGQQIAGLGRVAPEVGALAPPLPANHVWLDEPVNPYNGEHPTVINFWATWCGPCVVEMPELQQLHEETNAVVVGVNLGESVAQIEPWLADLGITYPIVLDHDGLAAERYRLRGQPTTVIVGPDGIITDIFFGPTTFDTLRARLPTS